MDQPSPREALDLRDALGPARHHELQREVFDADFLVAADSFGDLLRRAVETVLFPLERLFRDLDREAHGGGGGRRTATVLPVRRRPCPRPPLFLTIRR